MLHPQITHWKQAKNALVRHILTRRGRNRSMWQVTVMWQMWGKKTNRKRETRAERDRYNSGNRKCSDDESLFM